MAETSPREVDRDACPSSLSGDRPLSFPRPASLRARESSQIESFYRTHWSALVAWLRRRYGAGPPSPEDIAQTAFARLAAQSNLDQIESVRAYIYATAANVAIDEIRWINRTRIFIELELRSNGEVLEEITPDRIHSNREQIRRLGEVLDRLPPKQREIIRRSRLLGQTYAEIAAETGWSLADISRQLTAALRTMHRSLSEANMPALSRRERWR